MSPLMSRLPYRLKDTTQFLRIIKSCSEEREEKENPPPIILVSWDIEAMYPNIDNDAELQACRELFDERESLKPSTDSLIEAIKITLEENIAEFDGVVVKQKSGTAMGPHHACSYADAAVDKIIDKKVMDDSNQMRHFIELWTRFRDDIFSIWTGSYEQLMEFHDWLNSLNSKLRFTINTSVDSIEYLDVVVSVVGQKITTAMYSKPSDTHAYLLPTSNHPTHICKNIPKGVMKRVTRNCSEQVVRDSTYEEYKEHLLKRGYSNSLIDDAISTARAIPRDKLLGLDSEMDEKETSRKFPLIIKFNHRLPQMSKMIRENIHILSLTPETSKLFNLDTVFTSYKMEQNILSMITKNRLKASSPGRVEGNVNAGVEDGDWGCFGCDQGCTLCQNFLVKSKTFTTSKTNQTFKIKSHITCDTKNVIYLITDKICSDVFYVGYTEDNMKVRWRNHKSHIKQGKKTCEIASHFNRLSKTIHKLDKSTQALYTSQLSSHLSIVLIECVEEVPGKTMKEQLEIREKFWQGTLKAAKLFGGINKR